MQGNFITVQDGGSVLKLFAQSKLFICEMCHNQTSEKIDGDQRYIVHHKVPLTPKNIDDPYITCGWDNLIFAMY